MVIFSLLVYCLYLSYKVSIEFGCGILVFFMIELYIKVRGCLLFLFKGLFLMKVI